MGYEIISTSICGREHQERHGENQDSFLVGSKLESFVGFVADGMGKGDGLFASKIAVTTADDYFSRNLPLFREEKRNLGELLKESVVTAHQVIGILANGPKNISTLYDRLKKDNPDNAKLLEQNGSANFRRGSSETLSDLQGLGTTLTAWFIEDDKLYVSWLGDSPAIMVSSSGRHEKITRDHRRMPAEINLEEPTRYEVLTMDSPLSRYVGQNVNEPEVDLETRTIQKGDTLLVSTRGLTRAVSYWGIVYALSKNSLEDTKEFLQHHYLNGDDALLRERSKMTSLDLETSRNELAGMKDCTFTLVRPN